MVPNGNILASGSTDTTIKIWDVCTFKELATLTGHTDWVRSICFSPNGNILASGSDDRKIKLWDMCTYQEINTLRGHTNLIRSVCFSPTILEGQCCNILAS